MSYEAQMADMGRRERAVRWLRAWIEKQGAPSHGCGTPEGRALALEALSVNEDTLFGWLRVRRTPNWDQVREIERLLEGVAGPACVY